MVPGKKQFGCHNVFAHLSNVLPRECRGLDLNTALVQNIDVFYHDNRIGIFRHNVTGIDIKSILADDEFLWLCFTGSKGVCCFYCDPVHCR